MMFAAMIAVLLLEQNLILTISTTYNNFVFDGLLYKYKGLESEKNKRSAGVDFPVKRNVIFLTFRACEQLKKNLPR